MDLSGLPETAVDSEEDDDEEDIERASDPLMSRDIVRDCLEKDPIDRTDDDIGKDVVEGFLFIHVNSQLDVGAPTLAESAAVTSN